MTMSQYIRFACSSCCQHIEVDSSAVGGDVQCPGCGNTLIVPEHSEAREVPPKQETPPLKPCPMCGSPTSPTAESCPGCGHVLKKRRGLAKKTVIVVVCTLLMLAGIAIAVPLFLVGAAGFFQGVNEVNEHQSTSSSPPLTAQQQAQARLLKQNMEVTTDDFRGLKFLEFKHDPIGNQCRAYISQSPSGPGLRLYIQYQGDDWLFVDKYLFKFGDLIVTVKAPVETDNGDGKVWETSDISYVNFPKLFHAFAEVDQPVKMRYDGKTVYDRTLSPDEVQEIRDTILVYRSMGGDW